MKIIPGVCSLFSVLCPLPSASPQGRPFGKRRPTRNPAPSPSRAALSQGQPTQALQHLSSRWDTTHKRPTCNTSGTGTQGFFLSSVSAAGGGADTYFLVIS